MAKLDEKEMKVFAALKKMKTGKLTVVKYGGEIKHVNTEVDEIIADRAAEETATARGLIRLREQREAEQQ